MRVLLFWEGGGVGKRESWHILCQKLAISPVLSVDRGLLKLWGGGALCVQRIVATSVPVSCKCCLTSHGTVVVLIFTIHAYVFKCNSVITVK